MARQAQAQGQGSRPAVWRGWKSADYLHRGVWAVHLSCGHTENLALVSGGSIPDDRLFRCSACEAAREFVEEDSRMEVYRAVAKRLYGSEIIEVDDGAAVSVTDEGSAWVQAWVCVEADALQLEVGASPGALPACGACGSRAGWVISSAVPVYVTVEPEGRVSRVRVNDEALELEFGGGWNREEAGGRSPVTCKVCDAPAPEEVAQRVRKAAEDSDEWASWEFGA